MTCAWSLGATAPPIGYAMKSIFVDCNKQFEPVFAAVHRADDPPIAVYTRPFTSRELPQLLAEYDICVDDHSYMPTEFIAQCKGLKHIVFFFNDAATTEIYTLSLRDALPITHQGR